MPFVYAIIKMLLRICRFRQPYAGMAELADVQVLGSCAIGVWVQIPLPAPSKRPSTKVGGLLLCLSSCGFANFQFGVSPIKTLESKTE